MMKSVFEHFSEIQFNILVARIVADGEISKLYPGSRRKNNSYREHFGLGQKGYREWKASFFPDFLYIRPDNQYLVSKSNPLLTELYPNFYNLDGNKKIPGELLSFCKLPHFLAILLTSLIELIGQWYTSLEN